MHDLASMFERQAARGALADLYWARAGGRPGHRVADVGCGAGWFTLRYAALAGPTGHVHAVDASEDALAFLRDRLDPVHHAHVTLERLDVGAAPLPALHFHALFMTDALHHVEDVPAALRHLREADAPLVLAEFDPDGPGEIGPPHDMRLAPRALVTMLRAAGWRVGEVERAPFEHYVIVATPGDASRDDATARR